MTKKDLIKKILELGKELEKANGFDAVMIINDMEIEVDNYTKQLPIHNVVGRSEQLVCDHLKHTFFRVIHKIRKCNGCGELYEAN